MGDSLGFTLYKRAQEQMTGCFPAIYISEKTNLYPLCVRFYLLTFEATHKNICFWNLFIRDIFSLELLY
ncbi:hypothetical protein EDB95_0289 [Dinghuibacter silviterrae]|uniref:Uncharacterized protein n=1 Tax=Dinghuibacter silviterrae TaxID=1539049 RepID=A0A4R8DQ78_9BACT|nr:hypothetical protein EDB95_0289 [Dinghuibacter silviterrae]